MGKILTVRATLPKDRQVVTLGEGRFSLVLAWLPRLGAWYADLYQSDGTAIWLGQRVTAGWGLGGGLRPEGRPDGVLFIRAPDVIGRLDLGASALIVFYPTEELPDPAPDPYPVVATLVV